jgi:CheY-like chemotaxis protein
MKKTVLIVDDEQSVVDAVSHLLRAAGFGVRTARDGNAAVEEIKRHAPDLVLSDVGMPQLNGFQMCRQLKSDPQTSEVPVVLMSQRSEPADAFWAKQVGALALLRKPIESRKLVEQITEALIGRGRTP